MASASSRFRTEPLPLAAEELSALVEVATLASGREALHTLVRTLAQALDLRVAFVCERVEGSEDLARTRAICEGGQLRENFDYRLSGTPCGAVYEGAELFLPRGVQGLFPEDEYLREVDAQGYLGVRFHDINGKAVGHIGVIHDRPLETSFQQHPLFRAFANRARAELERRHAQQVLEEERRALAAANAKLLRANRQLEEFASFASHDLQEPIRKLVAFSDLLREDAGPSLPAPARRDLDFIVDGACRMQALVRDLLVLSRTAPGELRRQKVALEACAERALERLALRVQESEVRLSRDPLPELPVDPTLVTSVYQNLILNALAAQSGGPAEIHLSAECRDGLWVLGVRDGGVGIALEHQDEIFRPFRRVGTPGPADGSGIGLAICRQAVERHDGRIWVESEPGQGAHFRFTLGP